MEIVILIFYILLFLMALFLSFASLKYFKTMWKYKNRKNDGSEDEQFKMFD